MPIKWKKRKGLRPQTILDKIESAMSLTSDGRVAYAGFGYHEAFASLFSMLTIPTAIANELDVHALISRGISKAAKEGNLTESAVANKLNELARNELSKPERKYALLTSLSVKDSMPFNRLKLESATLYMRGGKYPKKYSSRRGALGFRSEEFSLEQLKYQKIVIVTKAKSARGAATKALDSLDLVRAILALFSNPEMELIGNSYAPINKIRLGNVHTLHEFSGKLVKDIFWFEPNFLETVPFKHQSPENLERNFFLSLSKLNSCPYREVLTNSLLQFVRALDERDNNSAAIRLWTALEILASPGVASYDKIIRRCSFLFEEAKYHGQVLEHLREFRNSSIHSGDQSERAKSYCYQMQFYFRELVLFHLRKSGEFSSVDEANRFLDLPPDGETLLNERSQLEKAIMFRRIKI